MTNKKILLGSPVTQSTAAVVELSKYLGKAVDPLPAAVELSGMVLVLNNKKDAYYLTSRDRVAAPLPPIGPARDASTSVGIFPVLMHTGRPWPRRRIASAPLENGREATTGH